MKNLIINTDKTNSSSIKPSKECNGNHNPYLRPRCLNDNKTQSNQPLEINSKSSRSKQERAKKLLQRFSNSSSTTSRRRLCFDNTANSEKNFLKSNIQQQEKRQNVDQTSSSTVRFEDQNETKNETLNQESQKLTGSSTSNISTPFSLRKQIALAVQLSIDDYFDNSSNDIKSCSNSPKLSSNSVDYFDCSLSSLHHKELDNQVNNSFSSSNLLSVSPPIITTPTNTTLKKLIRNNKGETGLHLAAIRGDFVRLEYLLSNKKSKNSLYLSQSDQNNSIDYDINVQDFAGWTALHEACNRGHIQAVRVLLNHGANVNASANCGTTPLIDAASNGHNTIVKLLLDHGANPLQKDKRGLTAIDLALDNTIKSTLNLYLEKKQEHILPSSTSDKENSHNSSSTNNCPEIQSKVDKFKLIEKNSQQETNQKVKNPWDNDDIKVTNNMSNSISITSCVTTATSSCINSSNLNQTTLMSTSTSNTPSSSIISSSSSSSSIDNPNKNSNLSTNNTTNTNKKISKQANNPLIKSTLNAEQNADSNTEIVKLSDDSKSVTPSTSQLDFEPHLVETKEPIKLSKPDDSSSNIQCDSSVSKIDQPVNLPLISEYSNVTSSSTDPSISHQLRGRKQRRNGGHNDKKKVKKMKSDIANSEIIDLNKMDTVNKDFSESNLTKNCEEKAANEEKITEYSSTVNTTGSILTTQTLTNTTTTISSSTSSSISTTSTTNITGSISNSNEQMRVPPIRIVLPSSNSANCNANNNANGSNQSGIIVINSSNNAIVSSGSTNISNNTGSNVQTSGGNHGEIGGGTTSGSYLPNVQTHHKYPYVVSTSGEQQMVESNKNENTSDSASLSSTSTPNPIYSSTTSVTTATTAASTHRITRSSQRVAQQKHYIDEIDSVSFGTRKKKNRTTHGSSHTTGLGHTSNSNLANNTINTSIASSYYNSSSLATSNNQSNNFNGANGGGSENFDDNNLHSSSNAGNGNSNVNLYNYVPERASSYRLSMWIRKFVRERRKHMPIPKMTEIKPQNYNNYLINRCDYLLRDKNIPEESLTPPPAQLKGSPLYKLFMEQEQERQHMRIRHKMEQQKLIIAAEQDTIRLYNRAEMYKKNQTMPLSVCTYLKDEELYNKLELETDHSNDNVIIAQIKAENPSFLNTGPSALTGCGKIRCNGRVFLSWKRDEEDKWNKIKNDMLNRQRMEAEALSAKQRLEWDWKIQELEPVTPGVNLPNYQPPLICKDKFVPTVEIVKDFELNLN